MFPQPYPTYWDVGNDGSPDPSVGVDADGGGWTRAKLDRLTSATSDWASHSHFRPFRVISGANKFWVDGTKDPACTYPPESEFVGATCTHKTARILNGHPDEVYYDISQSDTTFSTALPAPLTYWYGSTHTGAENTIDFQGVVTHEMGHWIFLRDVYDNGSTPPGCNYGTGMYTMCGAPQSSSTVDDDTWRLRGPSADDVAATNLEY